jgi:Clp amino terminal domain, pathogenicity island component
MNHKHIGPPHLVVGLLREETFAAQLLREQGLTLYSVRRQVQQSESPPVGRGSASFARLDQWLAELEARGGIWTVKHRTTHFAIYADNQPNENEAGQDMAPAEKLAQIRDRIDFIVERMEHAISIMNSRKRASIRTKNGKSARICARCASSSIWKNHRRESRSCASR